MIDGKQLLKMYWTLGSTDRAIVVEELSLPSEPIPYDRIDANILPLVRLLNELPGIKTDGSCGGHANPTIIQHPEGEWFVSFRAIKTHFFERPGIDTVISAITSLCCPARLEYDADSGEWFLSGHSGIDPLLVASLIHEEMGIDDDYGYSGDDE